MNNRIVITRGQRSREPDQALPFEPRESVPEGFRQWTPFGGGWLVGFDQGEFGGALWWFDRDGVARTKLDSVHVIEFVPDPIRPDATLILEGLAHLASDRGRLLRVTLDPGHETVFATLADLGSQPLAHTVARDRTILIATRNRMLRYEIATARLSSLALVDWGRYQPSSVAASHSGAIYVGMRHFVVRLAPGDPAYEAAWFVPEVCFRGTLKDNPPGPADADCACGDREVPLRTEIP